MTINKNHIALHALGNAALAACYVALIAAIMSGAETFAQGAGSIVGPMGFLLLFSSSAAILGLAVFGRPLVWYLDGKRAEAVTLAIYTVSFLLIITLATFLVLASL